MRHYKVWVGTGSEGEGNAGSDYVGKLQENQYSRGTARQQLRADKLPFIQRAVFALTLSCRRRDQTTFFLNGTSRRQYVATELLVRLIVCLETVNNRGLSSKTNSVIHIIRSCHFSNRRLLCTSENTPNFRSLAVERHGYTLLHCVLLMHFFIE